METLIKTVLGTLVFISLVSCMTQKPISSLPSNNNKDYKVEYLFEHDGCKVYRFMDNFQYVYFTNCNNQVTSAENDSTQVVNIMKRK